MMKVLKQFGNIPVSYHVLASVFSDYKSPADKLSQLEKQDTLIRLKKGMYVVSPEISGINLSRELIANHIYGPSYVSLESALSFYGIIPEKVFVLRSVTPKRSTTFSNSLGTFDYISVPELYYSVGIRQEIIAEQFSYMIASPEKALCDMIQTVKNHRIQSVKAMQTFLEDDLRIDMSKLFAMDVEIIRSCIETGKKKMELTLLLNMIQ